MRHVYLKSTAPEVLDGYRRDAYEYTHLRGLERWFEKTHNVALVWHDGADGSRTVEGVRAVLDIAGRGKGDLDGHWNLPANGLYRPCHDNKRVWRMFRELEWRPKPLAGLDTSYLYMPYRDAYREGGCVYVSMPVASYDENLWSKTTKGTFNRVAAGYERRSGHAE